MSDSDRHDRRRSAGRGDQPRPRPRPRKSNASRTRNSAATSGRKTPARAKTRPGPARRRPANKRAKAWRIAGFAALATALTLIVIGVVGYFAIAHDLPEPGTKPKGRDQTTIVTDRNGDVIAKLFAEQNRTDRPLAEIPIPLRQAVIATEDQRFYEHKGVDPWGILRALWVDITQGKSHGGSTITQQYVKTAFLTPEQTLTRKVKEALFAYRVEKELSKDQILELYLNTIYFGHGAYGVEAAAEVYFGKPVDTLSLAECATLAGVIKSPGRFSPHLDPVAGKERRDIVLMQMEQEGYIDTPEKTAAQAEEFALVPLEAEATEAPYFMEYVKAQLIDEYGAEAVFRGGMKITTTIDLRMQRAAEKAVSSVLDRPEDPSAALVAINPVSGEILAMVGGRDFATQQFNVAVQGRRQPGSAFKPFVLASALDQGVSPEAMYASGPASFPLPNGQTWKVTGTSDGTGTMRLRQATEKSVNSVYAKLILDTKPERTVEMAEKLGIHEGITPVPAIALGGLEEGVSPLEMASAYGTLAAGGKRTRPFGIKEIADAEGKVLRSFETSATQAIQPDLAYLITDILRGVISRGTGTRAAIGRPAAGKTGTTQEYRDAWFCGYTPQLVAAVWVGYPDSQREMKDVHGRSVTGGSFPADIWSAFMKDALTSAPKLEFVKPKGIVSGTVCAVTGLEATEWCTDTLSGIFLAGHTPKTCDVHTGPIEIDIPDLIGMTKENAIATLQKLMLLFKVVEQDVAGVPVGIVARQDPASGSVGTTQTVVTITVSNGGSADLPPKAEFTISPAEATVGAPIAFDASASSDNTRITRYFWEFGDSAEGEGVTATHAYDAPGTFEITLWVTDEKGQTSSITHSVTVR